MYFGQKGGGEGVRPPNINFLDFILVELLNLVTEKFNLIFGLNFWGEGGGSEIHTFIFLWMTSRRSNMR